MLVGMDVVTVADVDEVGWGIRVGKVANIYTFLSAQTSMESIGRF